MKIQIREGIGASRRDYFDLEGDICRCVAGPIDAHLFGSWIGILMGIGLAVIIVKVRQARIDRWESRLVDSLEKEAAAGRNEPIGPDRGAGSQRSDA